MTDTRAGIAAAVAEGAAEAEAPGAPALQLPLLPAERIEALPADPAERRQELARPRGPGRPAGSPNRSTADWRRFILARYPSPLIALAETYSRPVQDLAAELGCDKAKAFEIQQRAAAELAPYLHGKMPVEVAVSGALPVLHLVDPTAFAGPGGQGATLDLSALRIEEIQGVSDAGSEVSDGAVSDEDGKGEADQ